MTSLGLFPTQPGSEHHVDLLCAKCERVLVPRNAIHRLHDGSAKNGRAPHFSVWVKAGVCDERLRAFGPWKKNVGKIAESRAKVFFQRGARCSCGFQLLGAQHYKDYTCTLTGSSLSFKLHITYVGKGRTTQVLHFRGEPALNSRLADREFAAPKRNYEAILGVVAGVERARGRVSAAVLAAAATNAMPVVLEAYGPMGNDVTLTHMVADRKEQVGEKTGFRADDASPALDPGAQPTVLHFFGHGSDSGVSVVADDVHFDSKRWLGVLLPMLPRLRCVFFSSCFGAAIVTDLYERLGRKVTCVGWTRSVSASVAGEVFDDFSHVFAKAACADVPTEAEKLRCKWATEHADFVVMVADHT